MQRGPCPATPKRTARAVAAAMRISAVGRLGACQLPHRGACLGEDPAVTLHVLGLIGAVTVLVDRLDDLRARCASAGEMSVEVIDEDPRHVRHRCWLRTAV